ncbi:MAG: UDP-N-acetylglucosamine 1-carboxyvinyltransferase, partial [Muribaculaceae bacterium]|nr:UDP-N-acetylglucosamine 1-carboxyvinyltransferase [Muribaculaceae bacterium]
MATFVIEGGHKLRGSITPQGAKNEALQVISATLLTSRVVTISNVPEILDVHNLIELLKRMGVKITNPSAGTYT